MRHIINELLLVMRFSATYWLAMLGYAFVCLSLKLLPKDHPSRIYFSGRIKVAKRCADTALRPHRQRV